MKNIFKSKNYTLFLLTVFIIAIVLLFYNFVAALQTRAQTIDAMADISESGDAKQEVDISGSTMPFMIIMLIIYIIAFIDAYKLCGETKGADHE